MIKISLRNIIYSLLFITCLVFASLVKPVSAFTCPDKTVRQGESVSALSECNVEKTEGEKSLMSNVNMLINVFASVMGFLAIGMIIYGGFMLLTAQGDPARIKRGKDVVLYSVIGLILVVLAYAIVNFVMNSGIKI
jgi:hypothetical protein cdivTM_30108